MAANKNLPDYSGRKFGRWSVIEEVKDRPRINGRWWRLKCACGTEKVDTISNIGPGHSLSCGCWKHDAQDHRLMDDGQSTRNMIRGLYKISARKRGLAWEITDALFDELTKGDCHYCGVPPCTTRRKDSRSGSFVVYNGVDRKDSTLGYAEGNVVSCCKTCQYAKRSLPYAEFLSYLGRVVAFRTNSKAKGASE
jgi:hypothetical protein